MKAEIRRVIDSVKDGGGRFALGYGQRARDSRNGGPRRSSQTIIQRPGVRLIPIMLGTLLTLLLGLIVWEYWLARRPWVASVALQWLDYVLLALLLLAAAALGALVIAISTIHGG